MPYPRLESTHVARKSRSSYGPFQTRIFYEYRLLYVHVITEQSITGAVAIASMIGALGKFLDEVQLGPHKRKVKKYLDEARTGQSVETLIYKI